MIKSVKPSLYFPLYIDVNDILNNRMNHLWHKFCNKAIANKQNCLGTRLLIVTFHEIAINHEPELKNQLVLLDISTNHNVWSQRALHFKLFIIRHYMTDFHLCNWLLSNDPLKIFAKLVIYLKHNIIFAKFLEIMLDNNATSSLTHSWLQSKNHLEVIKVHIFLFF